MAFSFGNSGNNAVHNGADGAVGVQSGPDLENIRTEALSFLAIGGENKVQLSSPWPSDNLPPPTASLISIASHKGLIAAAGPDAIILATTESVRKAFDSSQAGKLKQFQPQLRITMPIRISQLAFSADESYLVLSAETGGGLAVYETQALLNGLTQSAFELSTNGQALRAMIPNPTAEKGELFAVITADGSLMMANLKERKFMSEPNGQVLKTNASCLSWSTKGKQLVAGLADGSAYQMTPEGVGTGDIPKPPSVGQSCYVSSITWLENHVFLLAHTPSSPSGSPPASTFHVATRTPPSSFVFQKIEEPAGPWGMNRSPPHHFVIRLREFPPGLQDMIITTSTASVDIGLFTRSKVPLSKDKAPDKITGVFTMTEMESDTQRAQLPFSNMENTSAIGLALDLSSREKVVKPIPNDEIDESATPLPALMALNNEGVLSSWWIVFSDSIRQQTIYPNLVVAEDHAESQASTRLAQTLVPAFGTPSSSTFGASSTSTSAFGARPSTAFGAASGAFGAPSGLGQKTSVWGTPSNFKSTQAPPAATSAPVFGGSAFSTVATSNAPAFGSSSALPKSAISTATPAFGSTGLPGANRPSLWGSPASTTGLAFGQPSGLGKPTALFGLSATKTSAPAALTSGGFSSFASKGGFTAPMSTSTSSTFVSKPAFSFSNDGSAMDTGSSFGSSANQNGDKTMGLLGAESFSLGSTFKADPSAKNNEPKSSVGSNSSFFDGNFGSVLDNTFKSPVAQTPVSKETDMDAMDDGPKPSEPAKAYSTTPASTPAPSRSAISGSMALPSGLFGTPGSNVTSPRTEPAAPLSPGLGSSTTENPKPVSSSIGSSTSTPASKPPLSATNAPSSTNSPPSQKIKEETSSPGAASGGSIEPPLPPDPMSKTAYAAGDTSVSSTETDAPLPPDFISKSALEPVLNSATSPPSPSFSTITSGLISANIVPHNIPAGPEEDSDESGFGSEGDDDSGEVSEEGSGEDITKDLSPTSETNGAPGVTAQGFFKDQNKDMSETFFSSSSKPGLTNAGRGLFGEISASAPILPPPKVQASPRSPSPVRSALPSRMLRPDASRSVSAPGAASQMLRRQPPIPSQSTFDISLHQQRAEEQRRQEIRARKEQEEKQALVDDEDERMREFLASDLEGTRTLDEFIAYTDYNGPPSKDSISAQVETVYRDINAMIDTLGVNARALKCFVKGHEEQYKDSGRTREDLEDDGDWCLVEIESLSSLVDHDLGRDVEAGRIKDVAHKLEICNDLQKDLIKLHAKMEEVNKIRAAQSDPDFNAQINAQPLSAEQTAQQYDLRKDFTSFLKLLSDAEEALTTLKAKLVSQVPSSDHSNGSMGPTVDAVMRTIMKMTSMAEKRSGDIDVLEGQMRRLRFGSGEPRSREGSPFATAQHNRNSLRNSGTPNTYSLIYTPDSTKDTSRFRNSFTSSTTRTHSSPLRRRLSGYTTEEKAQIRSMFVRKKEVSNKLKEALRKRLGANVKHMDDDDDE